VRSTLEPRGGYTLPDHANSKLERHGCYVPRDMQAGCSDQRRFSALRSAHPRLRGKQRKEIGPPCLTKAWLPERTWAGHSAGSEIVSDETIGHVSSTECERSPAAVRIQKARDEAESRLPGSTKPFRTA
jgi:hypothetical protein